MYALPRQTDGRTNSMTLARRFVLTNASSAKDNELYFNRRLIRPLTCNFDVSALGFTPVTSFSYFLAPVTLGVLLKGIQPNFVTCCEVNEI